MNKDRESIWNESNITTDDNLKTAFFWNLSSNLQWLLVFLYLNSLYESMFLESLSHEYIEVHLYCFGTK